jgi:hypothetical protein
VWTFDVPEDAASTPAQRWVERTAEQSGDVPSARSVSAVTALDGSQLFVFGGESVPSDEGHEGAGVFTDDAFVLDQRTMAWTEVVPHSTSPSPRGWAGAAKVEGGVVVWGGLDMAGVRQGDGWRCDLSQFV